MMRIAFPILVAVLAGPTLLYAVTQKPPDDNDMTVLRDLQYGSETIQSLDLYLPAKDPGRKAPLVVWFHGGGWASGDKKDCRIVWLVKHGYAVASVNYRLSGAAGFPAQIHDANGAVRWLRAHAEEYGYDSKRIGAAGESAGGHLAALLGVSGGVAEFEGDVGGNTGVSSGVQVIVDLYGPTDLTAGVGNNSLEPYSPENVTKLLGGAPADKLDLARLASPVTHVGKGDPPLLIIQGDKDDRVPMSHSELLDKTYTKANLDSTLRVVHGAGHAGDEFSENAPQGWILGFLNSRLKN